jgi:hypothetical protein
LPSVVSSGGVRSGAGSDTTTTPQIAETHNAQLDVVRPRIDPVQVLVADRLKILPAQELIEDVESALDIAALAAADAAGDLAEDLSGPTRLVSPHP